MQHKSHLQQLEIWNLVFSSFQILNKALLFKAKMEYILIFEDLYSFQVSYKERNGFLFDYKLFTTFVNCAFGAP